MESNQNIRGAAVRAWREGAGMSQADLAALLSHDRTMVSNWENGRNAVTNDTLLRVAGLAGRGIDEVEEVVLRELSEQAALAGWPFDEAAAPCAGEPAIWTREGDAMAAYLAALMEDEGATPKSLRVTLVDPDGGAAEAFARSPFCPVAPVSGPDDACAFLAYLCWEMYRRLTDMSKAGVSGLDAYNAWAQRNRDEAALLGVQPGYAAWFVAVNGYGGYEARGGDGLRDIVGRLAAIGRQAGICLVLADRAPEGAHGELPCVFSLDVPRRSRTAEHVESCLADGIGRYGRRACTGAFIAPAERPYAFSEAAGAPRRIDYKAIAVSEELARSVGLKQAFCRWADAPSEGESGAGRGSLTAVLA